MPPPVTVGVVLYGDHAWLASRCLTPLLPLARAGEVELRIGLNECGASTRAFVRESGALDDPHVGVIESPTNLHKYPMMRRLLGLAPLRPHFMWFDDDSYLAARPREAVEYAVGLCGPAAMVGQTWTLPLGGNQHEWVKAQPWYAGKPVEPGHRVRFCTGGWWVIPSALLLKHDWPAPELERKGGDVMLGELCRQQGYALRCVRGDRALDGVRINADAAGRHSNSRTRGPMPIPRPVGWDFTPARG